MTLILSIWMVALILAMLLFIAMVRGWIMNIFFMLGVIVDAFIDIACQLWIDVSRIWKGKRAPELDEHESKLS